MAGQTRKSEVFFFVVGFRKRKKKVRVGKVEEKKRETHLVWLVIGGEVGRERRR